METTASKSHAEPGSAAPEDNGSKKGRQQRTFPAASFEDSLELARAIQKYSSGKPIRRLTLFDQIGKAPESGPSRQLITNSAKYGLTKGGYQAEQIELTQDGAAATDEDLPARERVRAQARLAIFNIPPFNSLFEKFCGNKLPAKQVLLDALKDTGLSEELSEEAVELFVVNLKFVGLLKTLSGADRIISIDHLLDSLPATSESRNIHLVEESSPAISGRSLITQEMATFETTCFYITPIGEEGSELRKHSDLFLGSIVEPALEPFKLRVIRADKIDKPGMITKQIIDYIVRSRLVIADLSFHNPNVFYELAIRHSLRLPTVQVIRKQDKIPFDLGQARTIQIDCTDIYSLVPKIETYRAEIAAQVRRSLEDPDSVDNPISTFYPNIRMGVNPSQN